MKIYISGPITGTTDAYERFERAEKELTREGHTVINPQMIGSELPEDTEHWQFMTLSMVLMGFCDGVLFLSGWERSKGCREEMERAQELRVCIFFEGGRG